MKITNSTKVTQVFNGFTIKPGETVDADATDKPVKRGRPRKDK